MESTTQATVKQFKFKDMTPFPYFNGKINVTQFLEATSDLITLVDHLGKAVAPVKYDMQGNVEKIKKYYKYDENSCLLELMIDEYSKGKTLGIEGILWLNRAFLFCELAFQEILICLQRKNYDVNIVNIFTVAYEGSVKKYHNWFAKQLFTIICKMAPTLPQFMKSLEVENDFDTFETKITNFNATLHIVRSKIDDFYIDRNLFVDSE